MHGNLSSIFIDNGLMNVTDKYGRTPLFYSNDYLVTTSLLAAGSNLYHLDNFGRTPFFYSWLHNAPIIELFIQLGIDLNIEDCHGLTFMSYNSALLNYGIFLKYKHLIKNKTIKLNTITINSLNFIDTILKNGFNVEFTQIVNLEIPYEEHQQKLYDFFQSLKKYGISYKNIKFIDKRESSVVKIIDHKKFL
jgi:hypothetical protein